VGGKPAGQIYSENRYFDLVVRLPEEQCFSYDMLNSLMIDSPQGVRLPLSELTEIQVDEGPVQISRENGRRRMAVELNVTGRDIGGFVQQARREIRNNLSLPTGYYLEWGGQFENQQQAMKRLAIITPIVIGIILLLLYLTFHSIRLALLVLCNLPFALAGGVFLLMVRGQYLSVPASVGFIVLFGVAVLNGVVLVSCIQQLRQQGLPLDQAIPNACRSRLRPILMTAATTVFGLIPMLLATGPGSEVQRPLAAVVVGGLFTATIATLLILPAFYRWLEPESAKE